MVQQLRVAGISAALVMSVLFAPAAWAQASGAATIAGSVKDSSGGVMPGVTVEAASPALIEKVRTAVTDAQGQYKIIDLRPATYIVTFSLPGFSTVKREGVELTPNATANVGAELTVGSVEETITVSGATPIVDVQGVTQTHTLSNKLLDTVPGAKGQLSFAAMTPSVVTASVGQDVGGSRGEFSVRMSVHGNRGGDQKLQLDGMRYNTLSVGGSGKGFFMNTAAAEEITVELGGGGLAEYDTGGVHINMVPKDGGNTFSGYFFTAYADDRMQGSNLDDGLKARGMQTVNSVHNSYDFNAAVGGPIRRDKLWFYYAWRHWGVSQRMSDIYYAKTLGTPANGFAYIPDLSRPADNVEWQNSNSLRLTWQATSKDKVTAMWDPQDSCSCTSNLAQSFISPEAAGYQRFAPQYLVQATWTRPHTNKLLFSAGATFLVSSVTSWLQPGRHSLQVPPDTISILEQSNGFRYNASSTTAVPGSHNLSGQNNQRFSIAYVTGSHNFKAGIFVLEGTNTSNTSANENVNYALLRGVPVQLTQYATPLYTEIHVKPDMGLYVQDQWTHRRLTLTGGLRFDYLNVYADPTIQPPSRFVPQSRSFAGIENVPRWKDLNPRLSAAYDLFGTGRTAVKASLGRFVSTETTTIASAYSPANAAVRNVNRSWTDSNGNFIPDCNLTDVNAQDLRAVGGDVCGRMSDVLFGQTKLTTTADPETLTGWQHRPFNWQASASIEHQLANGVAVSVGYYRTWFGNFTVTDNLSVTPADYDHYCITVPVDARLPGGGGNQICDLYDLNPSKLGQVNNFVTFADNYGGMTEVYNGVDVNFRARLPRGAQFLGGINVGNSQNAGGSGAGLTAGVSHLNSCGVQGVDNPSLRFCDIAPPYQARLKMVGSYPLPWDFQASATWQALPGTPVIPGASGVFTPNLVATNAQVAPSLGRNLSSGSTVQIPLMAPFSQFEARINQLDVRLTKIVKLGRLGRTRIQGNFDIYNLTNANPVLLMNTTYSGTGSDYLRPQQILDARLIKFSAQIAF
jgi:hypothetical protein